MGRCLSLCLTLFLSVRAMASEWSDEVVCYTVHDRFGKAQSFQMTPFPFERNPHNGMRTLETTLLLENEDIVVLTVLFREADEARAFSEMMLMASLRSSYSGELRILDQEIFRSTDLTAYSPEYIDAMVASWSTTVAGSHKLKNTEALTAALAAGYPYNPDRAHREGHIDEGVTKTVLVGCTLGLKAD